MTRGVISLMVKVLLMDGWILRELMVAARNRYVEGGTIVRGEVRIR